VVEGVTLLEVSPNGTQIDRSFNHLEVVLKTLLGGIDWFGKQPAIGVVQHCIDYFGWLLVRGILVSSLGKLNRLESRTSDEEALMVSKAFLLHPLRHDHKNVAF